MTCTLCGSQGHNRRTCQQWQILEAVRQAEAEAEAETGNRRNEEQILHTPDNSITYIDLSIINTPSNIFTTPIQTIGRTFVPTQLFPDSDYIPFNDSLFGDDSDDSLPDLYPITKATATLIECVEKPCHTEDCPICMEDLKETDLLVTRCGHQFHGTCMIRHMKIHDNCPMCRGVLFTN